MGFWESILLARYFINLPTAEASNTSLKDGIKTYNLNITSGDLFLASEKGTTFGNLKEDHPG